MEKLDKFFQYGATILNVVGVIIIGVLFVRMLMKFDVPITTIIIFSYLILMVLFYLVWSIYSDFIKKK